MAVKAYKRQLRVYLKPAEETEIKFPWCFFRPLNLVFVLAKQTLGYWRIHQSLVQAYLLQGS